METIEASQQATRWEGQDISGTSLDFLAFEQKSERFVYDISGVKREGYFLQTETVKDISEVVSMDFLQKRRDYVTIIQDDKGKVLYRIEGDEALAYQCTACLKNFTTKQSLERHHERFPLCRYWEKNDEPILTESVYNWAHDKIDEALRNKENPKKCKFCEVEFASVGNFHKHFKTSVVCNRLGMREIKKTFA